MAERAWRFPIPPEGRARVAQLMKEQEARAARRKQVLGEQIVDRLEAEPESLLANLVRHFLDSKLGDRIDHCSASKIPHKIIGLLIADHLVESPESPFTKSVIEFLRVRLGSSADRMLATKLLQNVIGELLDYHIIAEPESPITKSVFKALDDNLYNPFDRRLFPRIPPQNQTALHRLLSRVMTETNRYPSSYDNSVGSSQDGPCDSEIPGSKSI